MDGLLALILRDGKRPNWIDLTPQQRAEAIGLAGAPVEPAHPLRRIAWSALVEALERHVEAV